MSQLIPTYLLTPLREITPDRRHRAEAGLADGSLTITPTRHTETEIRALVKNGSGKEYGVTVSDAGTFCSCPDALYRGATCKHQLATCLFFLRQYDPIEDRVHLMWSSGEILCGVASAQRLWRNWSLNVLNWPDLVCPACVQAWTHPAVLAAAA